MDLKERFLKYVSYDTQSSEESASFPSTEKQKVLLADLRDEMKMLGLTDVEMDRHGYVMGTIPATPGLENAPVVGFIAHVDTSPDMSGADVKPRVIDEYDGGDLVLHGHLTMRVAEFPELAFFKGHTLIHTDGTTLLGADDKAGVAEIMTAAEYLMTHPEVRHGKIRIGFTHHRLGRSIFFSNKRTDFLQQSRLQLSCLCKGRPIIQRNSFGCTRNRFLCLFVFVCIFEDVTGKLTFREHSQAQRPLYCHSPISKFIIIENHADITFLHIKENAHNLFTDFRCKFTILLTHIFAEWRLHTCSIDQLHLTHTTSFFFV